MLHAEKYLRPVGIGVTQPHLLRCDDGNVYVVKLQGNRLGPKVLVNEYIAARFAALVPLCFPPGGVIEITADFLRSCLQLRRTAARGLHFGTRYLGRASYVHRHNLAFVQNKKEIAGVMLFDHLMHNADRTLNGKNMLLRREADGYKLYAIDNSHLFGSGRWRADRLEALAESVQVNRRRAYGTLLRHYLTAEDFAPYAAQFEAISEAQIASIVDDIPAQWLDDAAARDALKAFLCKRCAYASLIASRIAESIPNVDGRADLYQRE